MRNFSIVALLLVTSALGAGCGENQTFPEREPIGSEPLQPLTCRPNLDGRIDREELAPTLDVPLSLRVSPGNTPREIDVEGSINEEGGRVWDWSADLADDKVARISATSLSGKWYANAFPGGEFVAPVDAGGTLWAVYRTDAEGLWMLGLASAVESPAEQKVLMPYTQPVVLHRYPLQPGMSWKSVGEVRNATFQGLPYAGRDTYEVSVDAVGALSLPDFIFTQVHRVRTRVTIEPAVGSPSTRHQVSFLFECFGEVARATSLEGETEENFTTAAEIRRLGL